MNIEHQIAIQWISYMWLQIRPSKPYQPSLDGRVVSNNFTMVTIFRGSVGIAWLKPLHTGSFHTRWIDVWILDWRRMQHCVELKESSKTVVRRIDQAITKSFAREDICSKTKRITLVRFDLQEKTVLNPFDGKNRRYADYMSCPSSHSIWKQLHSRCLVSALLESVQYLKNFLV